MTQTAIVGWLMVICLVGSEGCSGSRSYVSHEMHTAINGKDDQHWHNMVTLRDKDSFFHTNDAKNWMERCDVRLENPQTQDEYAYPFRACYRESYVMDNTERSMATQFVTPLAQSAMQGAAIGSAGYFIGNGLGRIGSGSNNGTTINNNNAQEQGQGQDQGQGQHQGQGQQQGIKTPGNNGHGHGKR
jgi:hypothetical protein